MRLLRRAWHLICWRRFEADLAEEMEFHRAMKQQEIEERGVEATQAAAAARRAFGSVPSRDNARDVWIWLWVQDIAKDVRFAARLLAKDRRFTLAAVAALALGIAANTTIFTFINTALFKDLPFDEPRRLVALGTVDARGPLLDTPRPRRDFQCVLRGLSGLACRDPRLHRPRCRHRDDNEPERRRPGARTVPRLLHLRQHL